MRELQSSEVVNEQRAVCVSWLCYTHVQQGFDTRILAMCC